MSQLRIIRLSEPDIITWSPATRGLCTYKEAFNHLRKDLCIQHPQQGTRSVTEQAMAILQRIWKHKTISPCLKTFTRRLIRRALAIGDRAGRLSAKISKLCSTCNNIETDAHLFFIVLSLELFGLLQIHRFALLYCQMSRMEYRKYCHA